MTGEELIDQANEHQANGDHAAAAETYLKAFELMPEEPLLPWEAARLYLYFVSDAENAVRWFEVALPRLADPIQARDTRYHLGLAHTFLKDDARAATRFEEVLAETPTHVLSCLELGKIHIRGGDHERAKDLLQQAILHNNMRSTLPEMFPDGQRGSPHAHALAWINLGRLGLATEDEKLTRLAAAKLLEDLDDDGRVMTLAKEAIAAGQARAARRRARRAARTLARPRRRARAAGHARLKAATTSATARLPLREDAAIRTRRRAGTGGSRA